MKDSGIDHPKRKKPRIASNEHRLHVALARALVAEAAVAEAQANEKAIAKVATFWKAEALQERRRAARAEAYAEDPKPHKQDCEIHSLTRERLIKALRLLGSDQAGERARAALVAEKQRLMLGKNWSELIVRGHKNNDYLHEDDQGDDADEDHPKKRKQRSHDHDGGYEGPFDDYEGPLA